jgi:hypothetical protein
MNDTPIGWRVQLCTGAALAAMAGVAVRIDILNNWEYGKTVNVELATAFAIAAVAVVAIPIAAAILGWSRHLKALTWICVALTVWAAVNAYSAKQGAAILAAQSSQAAYTSALADAQAARGDAAAARKEAAAIGETSSADALAQLVTQASVRLAGLTTAAQDRGIICAGMKTCRAAETDLGALTQRLGQAKAKAEALTRAEKADAKVNAAKTEAKAGPAEASMVATVIAGRLGADASDVARYIALTLTGLGIAVTLLVSLLGGQAASLIGGAIQCRGEQKQSATDKPRTNAAGTVSLPGSQREALDRIAVLILNGNGHLVASGRQLAELIGVPNSTLAGWLVKWEETGLLEVVKHGNKRIIRLGQKCAA